MGTVQRGDSRQTGGNGDERWRYQKREQIKNTIKTLRKNQSAGDTIKNEGATLGKKTATTNTKARTK